jgi:glycosyltransferase involved in cell wall biosynthesis
MKILYLAPNIPVPGSHGGSTHVTSVYGALRARHEVMLVARRTSADPSVLAIGEGLAPVLKHLMPLYYLPRVLGPARRFAPDVIYERYSAFGLGVALGRLLDVPSVLMTLDRDASPISFAGSTRIVATSDSFVPERHRAKLRLVHWGVDPDRFALAPDEALRARLAPRGERLVVYTGSCAEWHGLDVLVDVAARREGPPVVFVIVGDGEDRARVEALAQARGVRDRFAFEGRLPHERVAPYVVVADACIAPYAPARHAIFRAYGMDRDPIKVLEYMAAGKPTLTIDTPRLRALFRAGEEVILYPADDAPALGRELADVLGDAARAARIGETGARLVRDRFTWARHADELAAVFDEAIREHRARASR